VRICSVAQNRVPKYRFAWRVFLQSKALARSADSTDLCSPFGLSRPVIAMIQFVLVHFAAQGIAVNAQNLRCARLIPFRAVQYAFDKAFLELANGFVK
jgi:hypothetical protein